MKWHELSPASRDQFLVKASMELAMFSQEPKRNPIVARHLILTMMLQHMPEVEMLMRRGPSGHKEVRELASYAPRSIVCSQARHWGMVSQHRVSLCSKPETVIFHNDLQCKEWLQTVETAKRNLSSYLSVKQLLTELTQQPWTDEIPEGWLWYSKDPFWDPTYTRDATLKRRSA